MPWSSRTTLPRRRAGYRPRRISPTPSRTRWVFYSWRGLTAPTVAALAIAAVDRARRPSGTSVGPGRSRRQLVRPVARDDERVRALVLHLEENQGWRAYTLREVARSLIAGLCAAEERSLWFDLELAWLLDPPA